LILDRSIQYKTHNLCKSADNTNRNKEDNHKDNAA